MAVPVYFTLQREKLFTYFNLVLVNFLLFKCTFLPCPVSFVSVNRVEMGSNLISDGGQLIGFKLFAFQMLLFVPFYVFNLNL